MATSRRNRTFFPQMDGGIAERINGLNWFCHIENWLQLPGLNADLASATEATREPVSNNWEVLGTNGTSALATFRAGGGLTLTTAAAAADQMILLTHLDTKQTALTQMNWSSARSPFLLHNLVTGASIADAIIWDGWKLTNTAVVATDADQAFFRYEEGVNSGKWQFVYSIGGDDVSADTGVAVALSTMYKMCIDIDSSRIARAYIDDVLVATSTALTSLTTLEYYLGVEVQAGGADGAKAVSILPKACFAQITV